MTLFSEKPVARMMDDGSRLNLRHGPIDLVIEAECNSIEARNACYRAACASFEPLLDTLCTELDMLRKPVTKSANFPHGVVAMRMVEAVQAFSNDHYMTPMIAVAGSVADHILGAMLQAGSCNKAYVNNGGDIALHLEPGQHFNLGICSNIETGEILTKASITALQNIGGIATSGWRGRSHSLGIADAVTVFAENAATADAAATLIANTVNLPGSHAVSRAPANNLSPDSDLGERLVTTAVDVLCSCDKNNALEAGRVLAQKMIAKGLISNCYLSLQGEYTIAGDERHLPMATTLYENAPPLQHGEAYAGSCS